LHGFGIEFADTGFARHPIEPDREKFGATRAGASRKMDAARGWPKEGMPGSE
jgi:hypothetical protein